MGGSEKDEEEMLALPILMLTLDPHSESSPSSTKLPLTENHAGSAEVTGNFVGELEAFKRHESWTREELFWAR